MIEHLPTPNIVIDLPLPSDAEPSNARPHFRAKAKAVITPRGVAKLIAGQHKPPQPFCALDTHDSVQPERETE